MQSRSRIISILAVTQIAAWGSMYYAFAVLAPRIVAEMAWPSAWVFGAFSWALVVAGLFSTRAGMMMDRMGGRSVMSLGSVLCALGLVVLSRSDTVFAYAIAWTILGLAMPLTLYEAAFATINRQIATDSRKAISILTLFAGFASSIFWPLTMFMESRFGWRDTYLIYGIAQILVCLPLHLALGSSAARSSPAAGGAASHTLRQACRHPAFWKLALAFAANSFVFSAMSVYLIVLFQNLGHGAAFAVAVAALIGPMQVAGRLGEMALARHAAPQMVGKLAFAALPAAMFILLTGGAHQVAVAAFCVLYGLANGVLTIVRGTLPQTLFGRENYGAISGALSSPSLIARAAAPLAVTALGNTAGAGVLTLLALFFVLVASALFYFAAVRSAGSAMPDGSEAPAS